MSEQAWIRIQRKTFTRWCNQFLGQREMEIQEMEKDLADGIYLHSLLELLSSETIHPAPRKNAKLKLQKIENLNTCLSFIKSKSIKLVGIGAEDIHDGKTNLILGLIWTLILRFQIVGLEEEDEDSKRARQALLEWCNSVLNPQGIVVHNFKDNWSNGRAFCGLVNALEPGTIDLHTRSEDNALENLNLAFEEAAQRFKFPKVLDAEDVIEHPDELSIMTYVSYFRAFLLQNTAYGPNCYAEGPGLTEGETKKRAEFTVIAVNQEGERATRGGARVRASLEDNTGKEVCKVFVKDNLNGTYACHYEATHPGQFVLKVMVGKHDIKDSPFHPTIKPGEPHPSKCWADGDGIKTAQAGSPAHFTVHTADASNTPIQKGGSKILAVLKDPKGDIPVDVVDNGDGTYSCSYVPKTAKGVKLEVKVQTEAHGVGDIKDSPFTVDVQPGKASAEHTTASGPGTKAATAGQPAPLTVTTADEFGNLLKSGGAPINSTLTHEQSGVTVPVQAVDNNDGTYGLQYTPEKAGTYLLDVKLGDESVKGSPFKIIVGAGLADPLNFEWEGMELDSQGRRVVVAGKGDQFKVTAKDTFGNPLPSGGLNLKGSLTGADNVPVTVNDNGDGSYQVKYVPTKAGDYTLDVKLDGKPVGGSKNPLPVVCIPAEVDPSNSIAFGPGLEKATIGKDNTFTIQARDAYGNDVPVGGANPGGHLDKGGKKTPVVGVDNGDGTYSCSYPGVQEAGNYELTPTLNGQPVKDAPFDLEVNPGDLDTSNTKVKFPEVALAGTPGPLVSLCDSNNNVLKRGGEKVSATCNGGKKRRVAARNNGDGTYTVEYPRDLIPGDYEVGIFLNDQAVPDSPFTKTIENEEVEDNINQQLQEVSPSLAGVLGRLFLGASKDEQAKVLEGLKALSSGQVKADVSLPEKPAEPSKPSPLQKPKKNTTHKPTNVNASSEIAKAPQEEPKEEAPKKKIPAGAVGMGMHGLAANVAEQAKKKRETRGSVDEGEGVYGKRSEEEIEGPKPEKAPAKGSGPQMGFGSFDVTAARAGLKKNT